MQSVWTKNEREEKETKKDEEQEQTWEVKERRPKLHNLITFKGELVLCIHPHFFLMNKRRNAAGQIVPNANGFWLFPGNSAILTCVDVHSRKKNWKRK